MLYGRVSRATTEVFGFVNLDFAGDLDKKRSITGYAFTLCEGAMSWKAFLHLVLALSTIEA